MVLRGAKITGQIDMTGASFDGKLDADSLQVGELSAHAIRRPEQGQLQGCDSARREDHRADLHDRRQFRRRAERRLLQVGGDLLMYSDAQNKASFKDVNLIGAKITGNVGMGASFDGALNAGLLEVGGLCLSDPSPEQGQLQGRESDRREDHGTSGMIGASFDGTLTASLLEVGGNLANDPLTRTKPTSRKWI